MLAYIKGCYKYWNNVFNTHQGLVLFLMLVVIYLDCSFR
jgi:hypothetical protein